MDDNQATTAALGAAAESREVVACWGDRVLRSDVAKSVFVIGRGEGADVLVPHPSVSRAHARLEIAGPRVLIEDLGSANGVRVDGIPVTGRAEAALGSLIELGAVRVLVRSKATGAASPMIDVRRLVDKVAASNVSVILVGETGAGKEVLTEDIHTRSGRRGTLVRVNCAGLGATLLESELFGYERGAFTGAVQAKAGLIEAAEGGTLFLDELAEMPEATQPKLLRVIESREVRRLGALKAKPVDVRFVSATHKDPRTLAVMGRFRDDLLFRLNGLTIRVPPLRERRQEILALAEAFLEGAYRENGRVPPALSEGARVVLESYRWPGNVRELKNVIHRVALLCDDEIVGVESLQFDPPAAAAPSHHVSSAGAATAEAILGGERPATHGGERERIAQVLASVGGNQAAAAKALGITPRVLAYRMDKLGLPRPRRGQ